MSHAIDVLSLYERLFLLQHIAHGSNGYCKSVGLIVDGDLYARDFDPNYKDVWATTKGIVTNYLIECAVKLRMLQDFCEKHHDKSMIATLGDQAVGNLKIGRVLDGAFRLNIREASNKIIHAACVELEFAEPHSGGLAVLHWRGTCNLKGTFGQDSWHLELHVANWSLAVRQFLDLLHQHEMLDYLGQDYA